MSYVAAWDQFASLTEFERAAEAIWDTGIRNMVHEGAGDGRAIRANRIGWERWALRPRVLVDVSAIDTRTSVLGAEVSAPILFAPSGLHEMSHPDAEVATARAATAGGTVMVLSSACSRPLPEVRAAAGAGATWFQLYWPPDRARLLELVRLAEDNGCGALVVTVDMPVPPVVGPAMRAGIAAAAAFAPMYAAPRSARHGEGTHAHDPTLTWRDVDWLRGQTSLPLVLKGVLTGEDAALAAAHGIDAVIVSNHGGRVLDTPRGTVDALPEVVEGAGGALEVYVDGGVRRGHDVVVALALGARAVLIGRPVTWGLTVGGAAGAEAVFDTLTRDLSVTMGMIGAPTVARIGAGHVCAAGDGPVPARMGDSGD